MSVVIITGASEGIGAEIAWQLAQTHGTNISLVLAARSESKLQQVAQRCTALGARVMIYPIDLSNEEACYALVDATVQTFGQIDTLINNAGMSAHALLGDVKDLSWCRNLMDINFWGAAWCTHAALAHLKSSKGRIVAVSSHAGLFGVPGRSAYSATKFAMSGFFDCLRIELRPFGVSVTVAYPGVVATNIRQRGFAHDGKALGFSSLKETHAMSVQTCAKLIVAGMNKRKPEVVMTLKARLGRFAKLLAPRIIEYAASRAVANEVKGV